MTLEESTTVLNLLISVFTNSLILIYGVASIYKVVKLFVTF